MNTSFVHIRHAWKGFGILSNICSSLVRRTHTNAKPGIGGTEAGLRLRPGGEYVSRFVLARWRWRQGEMLQLPKKEVVRFYRPFRPLP
jgi:hypothetical protein